MTGSGSEAAAPSPGAAFRAAVEAEDLDALLATMSEEVVLNSPVSFKPFEGKAAVAGLLEIILRTFEDFRYTDQLDGEDVTALVFETRVGDRQVQGLDLIRCDEGGRVVELTVMVRPLSGALALAETVGPQLAAAAQARS